jgi:deoxyguanosine kinase
MVEPTKAYIGLGSNLGDRRANIEGAAAMLAGAGGIELARASEPVETAPLGQADQPMYLNAVAELKTALSAEDLHQRLIDIEAALGRVRQGKWSPRTIDLDLLLFGDNVVDNRDLTVPHPQMHLRSFVLRGLCQLNAGLIHPVLNETIRELADRLGGRDFALEPDLPQLVCIGGIIGVGKTTLAGELAARLGCDVLLEPYDTNPFMPDVYAGKKELALDSQLYFLTSRAVQLDPDLLAQGRICISDYVFDKELIYARRLLDAQQLAVYEEIHPPFAAKVAPPVLVIYMRDSAVACLERIHSRNRPYEQRIELPFLKALDSDYELLFSDWKTCPVIRVSTADAATVDRLANQIEYYTAGCPAVASGTKPAEM